MAADTLGTRDDRGVPVADTFQHHPWTVDDLVRDVASARVRLPDLQRPFVWSNTKVRDLIDSMYRGYPVGELMFWENQGSDHTRVIGDGTQNATLQVVDGQQRLTSLYAVVKGLQVWREDYTRETIRIAFSPIRERFEVPTPAITRSAEWIADITTIFDDPIEARHQFLERYKASVDGIGVTVDERAIEKIINQVAEIRKYEFQVVQLKEQVTRETVADVFVRINSEGVSLSQSDFILTWMSVFWEDGRHELEMFARNSRFAPAAISHITNDTVGWTPHNPYLIVDPGQMLRVAIAVGLRRGRLAVAYNRLRGRDPKTREINQAQREAELAKLKAGQAKALKPLHWDEYLRVIERAGLRTKELISSKTGILYTYALWLIGREDFHVGVEPLRQVMARWLFMSQLTGRYTGSSETRIEEDLARLDAVDGRTPEAFIATLNAAIDAAVPPDYWTISLPESLSVSSTRTPAYLAYLAALNILDAEVLLSTMSVKDWINPARRPKKSIEKHHLFPKDYLKTKLGVTSTKQINQVANLALLEWNINIDISSAAPDEYWPVQVAANQLDGERLAKQMALHALPDGWTAMTYTDFLAARRVQMAHITMEGFKRLSDPNYVPDLQQPQTPQEEPARTLPNRFDLVAAGTLPAGTIVTSADDERVTIGEITDDGTLRVGSHEYDSLTAAAREQNADVDDGWTYWLAHLDDGEPVLLADLREQQLA